MKKLLLFFLIIPLLSTACSTFNPARKIIAPKNISGTYNMIQVGGTFAADSDRLVILDVETDAYTFRPIAGPGRVKNTPGLNASTALAETEKFFSSNCAYDGFLVKELRLENGDFIGYEITPRYPMGICENGNDILVTYGKDKNGAIKIFTRLIYNEDDEPLFGLPRLLNFN